jgi:hypothetical protein
MLQNSYNFKSDHRKLVSVQVKHNYFINGFLDSCRLIPTQETSELLRNYEIQLRPIQGGIVLVGSNLNRFKSANFNGELSLSFSFIINDPYFLNYTDLSYDVDKKLFFSNTYESNNLHENQFADPDCQVSANYGNGVKGFIELVINGENEFFGEAIADKASQLKEYFIHFNSRNTVNRFNIGGKISKESIADYYIEDDQKNDLQLSFQERKLASGNMVFSAIMDQEYQLSEKLDQHFYLKNKDNTFYNFSKFLPNPKINNLSYNQEMKRFTSDVFISI